MCKISDQGFRDCSLLKPCWGSPADHCALVQESPCVKFFSFISHSLTMNSVYETHLCNFSGQLIKLDSLFSRGQFFTHFGSIPLASLPLFFSSSAAPCGPLPHPVEVLKFLGGGWWRMKKQAQASKCRSWGQVEPYFPVGEKELSYDSSTLTHTLSRLM